MLGYASTGDSSTASAWEEPRNSPSKLWGPISDKDEDHQAIVESFNSLLSSSGFPVLPSPDNGHMPCPRTLAVIQALLHSTSSHMESLAAQDAAIAKVNSDNRVLKERVARLSRELKAEERACTDAKILAEKHLGRIKELEKNVSSLEAQLRTVKKDYEKATRVSTAEQMRIARREWGGVPLGLPCNRCMEKARNGGAGDCDECGPHSVASSPSTSPRSSLVRVPMSRSSSQSSDTSRTKNGIKSSELRSPQVSSRSSLPLSPRTSMPSRAAVQTVQQTVLAKKPSRTIPPSAKQATPSSTAIIPTSNSSTAESSVVSSSREPEKLRRIHLFYGDEPIEDEAIANSLIFDPTRRTSDSTTPDSQSLRSMLLSTTPLPTGSDTTTTLLESFLHRQANLLNMLVSAPASVPGVTGPSRPVSPYSIASFAEQQEVLFDRQRGLEQQRRDITHAALELARERQLFQEEREMFFKESLSAETERTLCVLDKVMGELELD